MKFLDRVGGTLVVIERWLLAALLGALVLIVGYQVVLRNLGFYVSWAEDAAILLMTWMVLIGAAIATREGSHFLLDFFPEPKRRTRNVLAVLTAVATLAFLGILIWQGVSQMLLVRTRVSGAAGISMAWYFLSLPVGGSLMVFHILEWLGRELRRTD